MTNTQIYRMSFIWNALYAGFNALQSSVILLSIARNRDLNDAGIITIGFTLASFFMMIAIFGTRNYQVTDVNEEYRFADYFYLRIITVLGALISSSLYLITLIWFGKYSIYKGLIILEIIILKLVDAFEGLYVGRLQQKGRLDIGARISTIRIVVSTLVIFFLIWVVDNLLLCFLIGILVSIFIDVILMPKVRKYAGFEIGSTTKKNVALLTINVVPLCIGTAFHNYIGNAPKYLVDYFLTDDIQAISGYIMMPMFVVTVFNSFLMQPTVKKLGDAWNNNEVGKMKKMMIKHTLCILCVSVGVMFIGIVIGLPMLSWMYLLNMTDYKNIFVIVMIGGTLYTLSTYAMVILTVIRKQIRIVIGCTVSLLIYIILGKSFVNRMELIGASYLYIISNTVLLMIFLLGVLKSYDNKR